MLLTYNSLVERRQQEKSYKSSKLWHFNNLFYKSLHEKNKFLWNFYSKMILSLMQINFIKNDKRYLELQKVILPLKNVTWLKVQEKLAPCSL